MTNTTRGESPRPTAEGRRITVILAVLAILAVGIGGTIGGYAWGGGFDQVPEANAAMSATSAASVTTTTEPPSTTTEPPTTTAEAIDPARDLHDKVSRAWDTGDLDDIADIYDPAVVMVLAGDVGDVLEFEGAVLAGDRAEITDVIHHAIEYGNTYERMGGVASYEAADGDLYVAFLLKVVGPGHPDGDPVVGFIRVRDGMVIRHVVMDADTY
jgi:hypothetical protein